MITGFQAGVMGTYGFDPLSLFAAGEEGIWLDPSDFSTMFQDSAGTTPVTAADQYVGKILDKSGRGNHATQPDNDKRPQLKLTDGKYYLFFNGSSSSLGAYINFNAGLPQAFLSVGVRSLSSVGGSIAVLTRNSYTQNRSFGLYSGNQVTDYAWTSTSRGYALVQATEAPYANDPVPTTAVMSLVTNQTTDTLILRRNGVAVAENLNDQNTFNFNSGYFYIGARELIGNYFTGNIYSLLLRFNIPDVTTIANVERWVADKTGITL